MFWLTGILGILLILSPFVLSFTSDMPAFWSSIVLGSIILVVSAIKGLIPDRTRWEYIVAGILGLLAIIAPFALDFSGLKPAETNSVILGIVVLLLSAIQLFAMRGERRTKG
jgi:hypothetical protein